MFPYNLRVSSFHNRFPHYAWTAANSQRPLAEKRLRQERVTELGIRTREEIEWWNQMTALRCQTGETSEIPSLPSKMRIN